MQASSVLSTAAVTERYRARLLARQAGTFADASSPSVALVPPGRRPLDVLGPNGMMTNVGELTKQIFARMEEILRRIGTREGYTMILDRGAGVVWGRTDLDLTDRLIQEYNSANPGGGGGGNTGGGNKATKKGR